MRTSFAVFDGVEELDLVGPWEFVGLLHARGLCARPKLVSLDAMNPTGAHGMRFDADEHFATADLADVLVVPGGRGSRVAMLDRDVLSFLRRHVQAGETVMSVCTGSYLLQAAGILKGRRAVTHWSHIGHLRDDPEVTVDERRVVHDGSIWTCGGVSSGMDMMLEFVAERFGDEVAGTIQLDAEYFPSAATYGDPARHPGVTRYISEIPPRDGSEAREGNGATP